MSEAPRWLTEELATPFRAGIASVFIIHGDSNCLMPNMNEDDEDGADYVTMHRFLENTFADRKLVIFYGLASGAFTMNRDMEALLRKVAGIEDAAPAAGKDAVAAAKAGLAAKRSLPREPEACLPIIEKALRSMDGVAVVIKAAHAIAPATSAGVPLPTNERMNIDRIRAWGQSTQIRRKGNIVILMTDQAAKISQELRLPDSQIRTILVPKPSLEERQRFIECAVAAEREWEVATDLMKKRGEVDTQIIARACQGMSLRQISELFLHAGSTGDAISLNLVKEKKRQILNDEYGDIMEVIEPERGLEDIGGHEHLKAYFASVIAAIRKGDRLLVPMGVILMGPPGTGKTAFVEALAKGAGFAFVKTKNLRSMWLGESEARMEKMIAGLRSLAPVIVMNDEADLAEASRDSAKGDSGVSERLMKMWMEFLADPSIRGQVIVISCTNRADRIDAALKRSGRGDERILLPMPSATERAAIFAVMFKRHGVKTDIPDFAPHADLTNSLSGADIEKVTLTAYRFASERGLAKVDDQTLREAIADFIPSASMAQIDQMTVAGIRECSSRRLLPPHIAQIVNGILLRGLVPDFESVVAELQERNIIAPFTSDAPTASATSGN